jgi:hypothetical protein
MPLGSFRLGGARGRKPDVTDQIARLESAAPLPRRAPHIRFSALPWTLSAVLAVALAAVWTYDRTTEAHLRAMIGSAGEQAQVRLVGLAHEKSLCEAEVQNLRSTLDASMAPARRVQTADQILARPAAGGDYCARAAEAEALVRDAVR